MMLMAGLSAHTAEPYKVYTAMIYQDGVDEDPTVYVMHNTIGEITITRVSAGYFKVTSANLFVPQKTWLSITGDMNLSFLYGNTNELMIITRNNAMVPADNVIIWGAFIEIRVYNLE